MFQGFTQETAAFYWDLLLHNERPWFEAHKSDYIRLIKEPLEALAADTLSALRRRVPQGDWNIHVSRIYRDARRLHGHGPYKEQMWFTIWDGAREDGHPVFWFELSPSKYGFGLGAWATPAQMLCWRRYLDANPAAVETLARRFTQQSKFALDGPLYKRPMGERGEILNPWYNRRELDLGCRLDFGGELHTPEFPEKLADDYASLMPYYELLRHIYDGSEDSSNGLW